MLDVSERFQIKRKRCYDESDGKMLYSKREIYLILWFGTVYQGLECLMHSVWDEAMNSNVPSFLVSRPANCASSTEYAASVWDQLEPNVAWMSRVPCCKSQCHEERIFAFFFLSSISGREANQTTLHPMLRFNSTARNARMIGPQLALPFGHTPSRVRQKEVCGGICLSPAWGWRKSNSHGILLSSPHGRLLRFQSGESGATVARMHVSQRELLASVPRRTEGSAITILCLLYTYKLQVLHAVLLGTRIRSFTPHVIYPKCPQTVVGPDGPDASSPWFATKSCFVPPMFAPSFFPSRLSRQPLHKY